MLPAGMALNSISRGSWIIGVSNCWAGNMAFHIFQALLHCAIVIFWKKAYRAVISLLKLPPWEIPQYIKRCTWVGNHLNAVKVARTSQLWWACSSYVAEVFMLKYCNETASCCCMALRLCKLFLDILLVRDDTVILFLPILTAVHWAIY